jgi:hypothetical protein
MTGMIGEWYTYSPLGSYRELWAKEIGQDIKRNLVAWLDGPTKYIVSSKGRVEAFRVLEDPDEERPLELTEEQERAALLIAKEWWESHELFEFEPLEVDEDTLERLRALGYADDG